MDESLVLCCRK